MEITLPSTQNVIAQDAIIVSTNKVNLINFIDNPTDKKVYAYISIDGHAKTLILWSDASYDSIGDWTQEQAEDRIIELL